MPERQPVWFLAHGAPLHLLGESPVRRFWQALPATLSRPPRAILCLSAHWLTAVPTLAGTTATPEIQYDFYGFPESLYQVKWPLKGDTQTDERLRFLLREPLTKMREEPSRPLDHGVWVPLMAAWPAPVFPVYQLSLCPDRGAEWHLELGRRLAVLRDAGFLIIGSGSLVHNLARLDWQAPPGRAEPWAAAFMSAVETAIAERNWDRLTRPWSLPHGRECVPTLEHYLPFLVMLGTAGGDSVQPLYRGWEYGCLAMHSLAAQAH